MPLETRQFGLSDSNREALIIRWRTILILGLSDYFTGENRYSKIIVREILDIFEGLIKAFAQSLGVPIRNTGFTEIFDSIKNNNQIPETKKQRLEEINNSLSADELNSMRNLVRNPEAHSLNLPSVPQESVMRCWRLISDSATICDESIFEYAQSRPEFNSFINLHNFFYKYIIGGEYINLRNIKVIEKSVSGKDQRGKTKEIKVEHERAVLELIQFISSGDWIISTQ